MAEQQEIMLANQRLRYINPRVCGSHKCGALHSHGPTTRPYWLLHYVLSGKGRYVSGGISQIVTAGQCFVVRPNEIIFYESDEKDPWHYIWVGFTTTIQLPKVLMQNSVFDASRYERIFLSFLEAASLEEGREALIYGRLWELMAVLLSEEGTPISKSESYVEQAKSYIETGYMKKISIKQIADQLHLDRCYFSALFKKYTGVSPQQYLNSCRLEQAMDLLVNHGYTPTEAALSTGYADVVSFSHMFKAHFGEPPIKFRKK